MEKHIVPLAAVAVLFLGCGEAGSGARKCRGNAECPAGQYCGTAGVCTFDCIQDSDCPGGYRCSSLGMCVASAPPDMGVKPDAASRPDGPASLDIRQVPDIQSKAHDYVIDRIMLPLSSAAAYKYGIVHKGQTYNAAGQILALLASQTSGMDMQARLDHEVCSGGALILVRVLANSLSSDPAAGSNTYLGKKTACCTASACAKAGGGCVSQAVSRCFSGSAKLAVDGKATGNLNGTISSSTLRLGPGTATLYLFMAGSSAIPIPLKGALITGKISTTGITDGVLAGGIEETDLQLTVIPSVAASLDYTMRTSSDPTVRKVISDLFDTDQDGRITTAEVANNMLVKSFLSGDVDLDGDGKKEVSMGVGFTAVSCSIQGA